MSWFRKEKKPRQPRREKLEIPRDAWVKCEACSHTDIRDNFERNLNVCPNCDYHRRIRASDYLSILLDEDTIDETETDLRSTDPLSFPDYPARLKKSLTNAGDQDADREPWPNAKRCFWTYPSHQRLRCFAPSTRHIAYS